MSEKRLSPAKHQALGRALVMQIHTMLRTMRIHDPSNRALLVASENLRDHINTLWAALDGEVRLQFVDGVAYLNDVRLRVDRTVQTHVSALNDIFKERDLGGISFGRPVDAHAITELIRRFSEPVNTEEDRVAMRRSLEGLRELAMELLDRASFADPEAEARRELRVDRKTFSLQTYAKATVVAREVARNLRDTSRQTDGLHVVRIVQDLVDIATERVNFALKLAAIKQTEGYVANHAANTCVLSIVLGRALGVDRLNLVDLGLAALHADLGFSLIEPRDIDEEREFTQEEREELRSAMIATIRRLIARGRLTESRMRRMLVAYEHNQDYRNPDGQLAGLHPFARVVAVASAFDALTTRRPWREGYTAGEALQILTEEANRRFDPLVVKALTNVLGMYPLGSLVRLKGGEIAVVYHNSNEADRFSRPWVKLLYDASGERIRRTELRDLSAPEHEDEEILGFVPIHEYPEDLDPAAEAVRG